MAGLQRVSVSGGDWDKERLHLLLTVHDAAEVTVCDNKDLFV